jgi:hypothetical protein
MSRSANLRGKAGRSGRLPSRSGRLNFPQKPGRINTKPSASQADRLRPVEGELARILDASLVRQPVPELVVESLREITRVKAL